MERSGLLLRSGCTRSGSSLQTHKVLNCQPSSGALGPFLEVRAWSAFVAAVANLPIAELVHELFLAGATSTTASKCGCVRVCNGYTVQAEAAVKTAGALEEGAYTTICPNHFSPKQSKTS